MSSKFTSRAAARSRHLQQQAANPLAAELQHSAELFRSINSASPGLTAAEAARLVIATESVSVRRSASFQVLTRLGPLLDKLEQLERLG